MAKPFSKADSTRHAPRAEKQKKERKPINHKSAKRLVEEKAYSKVRIAYLKAFPYCEVKTCNSLSYQVHHKKGRIGSLLTDDNFFLAVCAECHKKIEENPIWAKENGYSLDRL